MDRFDRYSGGNRPQEGNACGPGLHGGAQRSQVEGTFFVVPRRPQIPSLFELLQVLVDRVEGFEPEMAPHFLIRWRIAVPGDIFPYEPKNFFLRRSNPRHLELLLGTFSLI